MAESQQETKKKDRKRVEKKIANHENLDELDVNGLTELHKAVMNTDIYSIQKLLEAGAGINVKPTRTELMPLSSKWTPLILASSYKALHRCSSPTFSRQKTCSRIKAVMP